MMILIKPRQIRKLDLVPLRESDQRTFSTRADWLRVHDLEIGAGKVWIVTCVGRLIRRISQEIWVWRDSPFEELEIYRNLVGGTKAMPHAEFISRYSGGGEISMDGVIFPVYPHRTLDSTDNK